MILGLSSADGGMAIIHSDSPNVVPVTGVVPRIVVSGELKKGWGEGRGRGGGGAAGAAVHSIV